MNRARMWIALVGLGASALLLAEYLSPTPVLCGEGGGCETVRQSSYASILGIPMPVLGLGFFAGVMMLTLAPAVRARRALTALASLGGAAGIGLIAIQVFVLDAVCAYCMVADLSAVAIAVTVLAARRGEQARAAPRTWLAYGAAALVVGAAGFVMPDLAGASERATTTPPGSELPELIRAHQTPGKLTIVEFIDFQCPACRAQSKRFAAVLGDYGDRVELVYKHWPLRMHEHAAGAARAAYCAEEVGQGKQMAAELFRASDLTVAGCEAIAASLGLDMGRFRACMAAERTAERVAQDTRDARELGVSHLPTYWIGNQRLQGVISTRELRAHIDAALKTAGI